MVPTYRILYVDDEPALLEIGKLFLERGGQFTVDTIASAPEALALLAGKNYDAVIADYQMPGMDGIEFLKKVRTSGNTIPFILFTGRGREEVVIQALNEGANFYLQKGGEPLPQFAELAHQLRQAIQQRRAEASVRDLERREADIINFLPDATFAIDTGGLVIAWNRAIEEMTGVSAAEMLGKGDHEYAIPFYGQRQPILIDLVFESDETIAGHYAHITHKKDVLIADTSLPHPRGKPVTLMGIASPLYDRQGRIAGAIESIRDITERKQAEDALRESEEKYRTLVENVIDIVYRADCSGTLVFVTPSILSLIGYDSLDEIVGHPITSFWAYPERRNDLIARMKETGFVKDYEVLILKRDGTPVPVSISSHFFRDDSGRIAGVEGIIRDISDRKKTEEALQKSEERYRNVVEDQTELISRFLPDGTHVFVNEAYCRYFGLRRDDLLGHRFRPGIPAGDRERVEQFFLSLSPEHPVGTIEHRVALADGTVRWQRWTDRAIFDPSGAVTEYQSVGQDITEQKEAGDLIRESEERYRVLVGHIQDGAFLMQDGLLLFCNEAFASMIGSVPEAITGTPVPDLIAPEDREMVMERQRARLAGRSLQESYEFRMLHRDGTTRVPVLLSVGIGTYRNRPAVIGTVRDVTKERERDRALRESEEKYRSLVENSFDGILIHQDGVIIYANATAARLLGAGSADEAAGKPVLSFVHPEFRDLVVRRMTAATTETQPVIRERFLRTDGSVIEAEVVAIPFTWKGRPAVHVVFRDITGFRRAEDAVKESEERFHELSDLLPQVVYEVDTAGNLKFTNRIAFSYFGYTEDDFRKGLNVMQMIAPGDLARAAASFRALMEGKDVAAGPANEYMALRKDGSTFPIAIYPSPIVVNGTITGLRGIIVDITERRRAEDALRLANHQLSLLTAITRHDMNNQMMVLRGWVSLLERKQADSLSAEYFRKINASLNRIAAMIEFTKEYESIGSHAPVWQDCRTLVETAKKELAPGRVVVNNAIPAGTEIFADGLVARVFYNLIDNAVRHGGKITAIRFSLEESGDGHRIICADDGDGIPADEKERIFVRGFGKNSGLGLFLAREILAITGITITENGTPGTGARFEIRVPDGAYRFTGAAD